MIPKKVYATGVPGHVASYDVLEATRGFESRFFDGVGVCNRVHALDSYLTA